MLQRCYACVPVHGSHLPHHGRIRFLHLLHGRLLYNEGGHVTSFTNCEGHAVRVLTVVLHDVCFRSVHIGDMANLVFSYAPDAARIVHAPIVLEDNCLVGAAAVAMPGTRIGKGATLGAAAATLPGAQLPGAFLRILRACMQDVFLQALRGRGHDHAAPVGW